MAWTRTPPMLALVAALAVACAEASVNYGESKFTVTGTVLCQDCTKNWNAGLRLQRQANRRVVAVTCLDKKTRRTVYHSADATDDKGVFNIEVP